MRREHVAADGLEQRMPGRDPFQRRIVAAGTVLSNATCAVFAAEAAEAVFLRSPIGSRLRGTLPTR